MAIMVAFVESSRNERRARTCLRAGSSSCKRRQPPETRFHRNQQYSITALTDGTGAVVERYAYTAYGQPTFANGSGMVLTSSAEENRYTYTGREWDELLGLYHYRARMYDPLLGRFVSRDPIAYSGSPWDLYEFLNSNPATSLDPTGHVAIDCFCTVLKGNGPNSLPNSREEIVTVNCPGVAKNCCKGACSGDDRWWDGKWKIVPGPDAYDDAEEEYCEAIAEIVMICAPVPVIGPCGRVGAKVCCRVVKKTVEVCTKKGAKEAGRPAVRRVLKVEELEKRCAYGRGLTE